jgi:hypothetical protein
MAKFGLALKLKKTRLIELGRDAAATGRSGAPGDRKPRRIEIDPHRQGIAGNGARGTYAESAPKVTLTQNPFALLGIIVVENPCRSASPASSTVRTLTRGLASIFRT